MGQVTVSSRVEGNLKEVEEVENFLDAICSVPEMMMESFESLATSGNLCLWIYRTVWGKCPTINRLCEWCGHPVMMEIMMGVRVCPGSWGKGELSFLTTASLSGPGLLCHCDWWDRDIPVWTKPRAHWTPGTSLIDERKWCGFLERTTNSKASIH